MEDTLAPEQFQGSAIDHINVSVSDIDKSLDFYERALNAIGVLKVLDVPGDEKESRPRMVGFGFENKPYFWLVEAGTVDPNLHVAFNVGSRNLVRRFFEAAEKAGGQVKLEPAVHPEYHEHYYAAFVHDPDGVNVEAVCHLDDQDGVAFAEQQGQAVAGKS
ncbi:VOC family protein [Kineosporia rhizophila]|uniref:VOC family protein n=1 Tax=Kineosporia TaxID=49184 RepID=UPI000AA55348|nr:VOC family protein [Kineosporia sp. NBRC 101677]MCE0537621.1 VOC family protein [Kineosporia rhizophila]GLY18864.1 glyoxalase [Kineosporia sp. NBRC 101677]